jgi:hypothetical protein
LSAEISALCPASRSADATAAPASDAPVPSLCALERESRSARPSARASSSCLCRAMTSLSRRTSSCRRFLCAVSRVCRRDAIEATREASADADADADADGVRSAPLEEEEEEEEEPDRAAPPGLAPIMTVPGLGRATRGAAPVEVEVEVEGALPLVLRLRDPPEGTGIVGTGPKMPASIRRSAANSARGGGRGGGGR